MENLGGWKPPLLGLRHLDVLLKVNRRSTSLTSMATIAFGLRHLDVLLKVNRRLTSDQTLRNLVVFSARGRRCRRILGCRSWGSHACLAEAFL